jgi:hypothetical protein
MVYPGFKKVRVQDFSPTSSERVQESGRRSTTPDYIDPHAYEGDYDEEAIILQANALYAKLQEKSTL